MKVDVTVTVEHTALETLTEADVRRFLTARGRDMVAQVRKNIVASGGKAAGGWPPLSKEYAKRKKDGGTPGKGKNRYAMLRDTGSMYDGLSALVSVGVTTVASVELTSTGEGGAGRPSNEELLLIHSEGRGRVPKRSPVEDMRLFEKRFEEELEKLLAEKGRATG